MVVGRRNRAAQALFQSISDDGTVLLFVLQADGGWTITRNGEPIAAGAGNRASIGAGVQKFLSVRALAGDDVRCDSTAKPRKARKEQYGTATEGQPR